MASSSSWVGRLPSRVSVVIGPAWKKSVIRPKHISGRGAVARDFRARFRSPPRRGPTADVALGKIRTWPKPNEEQCRSMPGSFSGSSQGSWREGSRTRAAARTRRGSSGSWTSSRSPSASSSSGSSFFSSSPRLLVADARGGRHRRHPEDRAGRDQELRLHARLLGDLGRDRTRAREYDKARQEARPHGQPAAPGALRRGRPEDGRHDDGGGEAAGSAAPDRGQDDRADQHHRLRSQRSRPTCSG